MIFEEYEHSLENFELGCQIIIWIVLFGQLAAIKINLCFNKAMQNIILLQTLLVMC